MDKRKISFKNVPISTGLAGIGEGKSILIKLDKKKWGMIFTPPALSNYKDNLWRITFSIEKKDILEDGNPNCTWKNITLNVTFETSDEAKEWIKGNLQRILDKWEPHTFEE